MQCLTWNTAENASSFWILRTLQDLHFLPWPDVNLWAGRRKEFFEVVHLLTGSFLFLYPLFGPGRHQSLLSVDQTIKWGNIKTCVRVLMEFNSLQRGTFTASRCLTIPYSRWTLMAPRIIFSLGVHLYNLYTGSVTWFSRQLSFLNLEHCLWIIISISELQQIFRLPWCTSW